MTPIEILQQISSKHGITILAQSRLKGLILDLMPNAGKNTLTS
jgi:hypothetical protein